MVFLGTRKEIIKVRRVIHLLSPPWSLLFATPFVLVIKPPTKFMILNGWNNKFVKNVCRFYISTLIIIDIMRERDYVFQ